MIHQFAIRPTGGGGGGSASLKISAGTLSALRTDVTFSNSNGVSFGLNAAGVVTATVQTNYLTTAMASNRGSDFVQATAAFAGTNASGTINSTGISVSVAASAVASVNFSAGTTSNNLASVVFSNSNNVSFGLNGSTITASIFTTYAGTGFTSTTTAGTAIVGTLNTSGLSLGVPAFLTTADLSQNSSKYAGTAFATTTSAGTAIAGTLNTSGLTLGVPPFLTTAMQSNAATISNINVSAGTTSTNASAFTFSNANNVSFGLGTGASSQNITASIATTYAGTGFTSTTTAGTAIVGTLNTSGLSLGVPAFLTTADLSQNSSKYAGTAFATTTSAGAVIAGTLNTSGLTLGVPAFLTTAMASNAATISNINVSAGTTSTNLSNVVFSNSNNVSFGLNGSTVTASYEGFQSYWFNSYLSAAGQSTLTAAGSTSYIGPFILPYYISVSYIRLPASFSIATASFATTANTTFSGQIFSTINAVVYSLGTGASSNSLQSVASGSAPFAQKWTWSAGNTGSFYSVTENLTYPIIGTTSGFTGNESNTQTNFSIQTVNLSLFHSYHFLDVPFANSLSPGPYWLMIGVSSTTSTQGNAAATNNIISVTSLVNGQANIGMPKLGVAITNNGTNWLQLGVGSFSTNAIGTTASLDLSNVSRNANEPNFVIQFIRQA